MNFRQRIMELLEKYKDDDFYASVRMKQRYIDEFPGSTPSEHLCV